uniref:2-oxoglutarate (2OG) and Fe(II)-dependent oxygenase superfamily protein, putative n=1 Tax=Trypanosoma brucei brucei (strain 927/4 GUTat10.1) TaxID=185431 RepID=B2ZWC0_TRYB2|nr:2-oxoglutarate (2OG) and Fe(II)-dependent oxygenase superfamily protein, putative [Trypanosoma brucei brucei TREU927]
MAHGSIPVIDVGPLFCDGEKGMMDVAKQIDHACRTWGVFLVVGHPIPRERTEKLMEMAKAFFSLPLEEKLKVDIRKSKHHRGYGCLDAENVDPTKPFDCKETFNMGCHLPEDHPDVAAGKPLRGPNNHPTQVKGWVELMNRHYREMQEFALVILRALALAIGLKKDFFDTKFDEPLSVFRMLHYPPQKQGTRYPIVCGEHTDYGIITLLYQDSVGGLQVRNLSDEWVDVEPLEGSFVVNIGDMMNMWSNGRYRSTPHRVRLTTTDRYSMPFFCQPNPYTVIKCLDHCHSPSNPPKYPPVRAVDWLLKRFAETYAHRKTKM